MAHRLAHRRTRRHDSGNAWGGGKQWRKRGHAFNHDPRPAPGSLFGEATYHGHTTGNETGLVLNYTTSATYAGNGTQVAVAAGQTGIPPSLTDNGHGHDFSVDVRQPAVALHIIMKV